jgi:hypothetical protein
MSDLDQQLLSSLDRLYPPSAIPADWPDVLQRADQLRKGRFTGRRRHSRRRRSPWLSAWRIGMAASAAVVALAVGLALTAPWRGGPDFIEMAFAAIGSNRYVTATVELGTVRTTDVDLASGRERPVRMTVTYWLDTKRIEYHSRTYLDGVPVSSETAGPDPALAAFAKGYRTALANRAATVVGKTTVAGHPARIIRFKVDTFYFNGEKIHFPGGQPTIWEDVAVDTHTFKPLWFRESYPRNGAPVSGPPSRVISIHTAATPPRIPKAIPVYQGTATTLRHLTATQAAAALGHKALWAGTRVEGLPLRSILLQRVTSSIFPVVAPALRTAHGLRLLYQHGSTQLDISEAATPLGGYGFASTMRTVGLGAIPAQGTIRISQGGSELTGQVTTPPFPQHLTTPWVGQLRRNGLLVTIQASGRRLLLAAARALAAMS